MLSPLRWRLGRTMAFGAAFIVVATKKPLALNV
jgi:hypothetical protein